MAKVGIEGKINKEEILWRYMSLDKLIDLFENESLFFSSLFNFKESDPYEGYLPQSLMRAKLEKTMEDAEGKLTESEYTYLESLQKKLLLKIYKSSSISCWHENTYESDAMWRLYSENNNGVAIKTSTNSLLAAIKDEGVKYGCVSYCDFAEEKVSSSDPYKASSPLFKRKAFEHERERRLFIINNPFPDGFDKYKSDDTTQTVGLMLADINPKNQKIKVNLRKLIDKIYISPFAEVPFGFSVEAVCKKYGFEDKVVYSQHLQEYDPF